jgi:hypothetical protein
MCAALAACAPEPDLLLPSDDDIASYYTIENATETALNGNVAELVVFQSNAQLQRGGSLWARVGPYIFLFSEPTRSLFEDFPGLAAVRVITRDPSGNEIARATLARGTLHDVTWRRSLNIAARARRDGSRRVALLESLIRWGEDRTEFLYSERYGRR